jgi:hypothetical protein
MLIALKELLTKVGPRLSNKQLVNAQAIVNYMGIGRWVAENGFVIKSRVPRRQDVWDAVIEKINNARTLYLEFGVAHGHSIRYWSERLLNPDAKLHGFDSFEGLPEEGGPWKKGQFDTSGNIPHITDRRVEFFKGWFQETLPAYSIPAHEVLVVNMDADLYSSTAFVLHQIRKHIVPGTFIYFDEMNHVEHEPLAFSHFLRETGLIFELVATDRTLAHMAFKCIGSEEKRASNPGQRKCSESEADRTNNLT